MDASREQIAREAFFYNYYPGDMICKTPRWKHLKSLLHNLEPEEFLAAFEQIPNAKILDVRTGKEFKSGTLPNAINLDFYGEDFWTRLEHLDKEGVYFVYCGTGRKSVRVCTYMKNDGFKHVFNLDGGFDDVIKEKNY